MAPGIPLPPGKSGADLLAALNRPVPGLRHMLYVHVPFCRKICTFCGFFRQNPGERNLDAYADAVELQAERFASTNWNAVAPVQAIYFGGGTPTVLSASRLAQLVRRLKTLFPLTPDCEITVETRFDGVDDRYLEQLAAAGVTRLSFGVQSFDTELRQHVGRIATREEVLDQLAAAQTLGFKSISVDLIYNLPGQTIRHWEEDLATLQACGVSGASVYPLILFGQSLLSQQILKGDEPPLGDLVQQYRLFTFANTRLLERPGWQRFGAMHFGETNRETSRYNSVRSQPVDVLGIGCGAGGFIGDVSYTNGMRPDAYQANQLAAVDPGIMGVRSPEGYRQSQEIFALAEGQGLAVERLLEVLPEGRELADQLMAAKLVKELDGQLELTQSGYFWNYNVLAILAHHLKASLAAHSH